MMSGVNHSDRRRTTFESYYYNNRGTTWTWWIKVAVSLLLVAAILAWMTIPSRPQSRVQDTTEAAALRHVVNPSSSIVNMEEGQVGGIGYYACHSSPATTSSEESSVSTSQQQDSKSVLLFHGSAFTKENWKSSGILNQLCEQNKVNVAVYALDLPVSATANDVRTLLDQMQQQQNLVVKLPIDVLVTPSASGKAIVEWTSSSSPPTSNDPKQLLSDYVKVWMPIASPAVASITPREKLSTLFPTNVKIVAVYGDQDAGGKRTMQLLQQHAGAELVELKGRHPCYLDSPSEFVELVLKELE